MKPRVVIVGAGLGGCYLASEILESFDVTFIEISDRKPLLRDRISDVGRPAITYPNAESGFGGTTKVWHNALMEIEERIFNESWPLSKCELIPYYDRAYQMLAGLTRDEVLECSAAVKGKLSNIGMPEALLSQSMTIPKVRINAWTNLGLVERVDVVEGEALELVRGCGNNIIGVKVSAGDERILLVEGDLFVLSAGGLGSPLLLQELEKDTAYSSLGQAGFYYEDHPCAFVGEIELDRPLFKYWNFPIRRGSTSINLRLPLSFFWKGLNVSFQLRPAHHLRLAAPRAEVKSVLSDLRNFPFNVRNYFKLLGQFDDLVDILSFKFGLRLPTRNYSILFVGEQPPTAYRAVWRDEYDAGIRRCWSIDEDYVSLVDEATTHMLEMLGPSVRKYSRFPDWQRSVYSSSHHSGTARISCSEDTGVCDSNGLVYGFSNLFVCDASAIPRSGFVNTGLTIVALSLRMAEYLKKNFMQYFIS